MTDLTNLTVAQIRDGHRAGDFSAVEVAEAFSSNVAGAKALNAFIVETPEHALAAAKAAGQRLAKSRRADQQCLSRIGRDGVDHLIQLAVFPASTINTRFSSPAIANAAGSWVAFKVRQGRRLCMAIISLISARLTGVFGSLANSV